MSELLARAAKAIHTLFFATEEAHERYKALEASIKSDEELAAFQALGVGLFNFDPIPPDVLEQARKRAIEEGWVEEKQPETNGRITIVTTDSDEGRYVTRLLTKMYANWNGTLDYESGVHRFSFFSPFDLQGRRVTMFAEVAVDGESPDVHTRSYTLGPYLRVSDARTKRESDDPWRVLNGDLTPILPEAAA